MINILELEPTKISRNLRGKFILLYGRPKIGKTTLLSKFPKCLILAFEPGTNALNSAFVQPITKWTEMKQVLQQLRSDQAKEKYHFIGIDTADVAWEACERYICLQNDVASIGDIPWGKGYKDCEKEFSLMWRELALLGYGLCFISHESEKTFKNEKGEDYIQLSPALSAKPYGVINKLVDIIGYIRPVTNPETKEIKTMLFFRGDDRFLAGSRLKYIEPQIEFSYENLINAIQNAVDMQVSKDGAEITEETNTFYKNEILRPFEEAQAEAKEIWMKFVKTDDEENIKKILAIIEKIFGRPMKLSEATETQQDLLELVISEMRLMG